MDGEGERSGNNRRRGREDEKDAKRKQLNKKNRKRGEEYFKR